LHDFDNKPLNGEGTLEHFHPARFDLGQIQNVVDRLQQMRRAGQDIAAKLFLSGDTGPPTWPS